MGGVHTVPVMARALLVCDRCRARWESDIHSNVGAWDAAVGWCSYAWQRGWRVFAGARSQRTYCPNCAPSVPMRQIYPRSTT